jgi:hypothetical protein
MTFSVLWTQEAFAAAKAIIDDTPDTDILEAAIRALDAELRHAPGTKGESRDSGRRILFAPPLAVTYEIHWRLNEVLILHIWKFE